MGKQNMYDCSVRMPLLISGPRIAPGKRVNEMVYQHSMYATTCDLAHVPVPDAVEFPSLAPMLLGEANRGNESVFCYYRDFQRMLRTKQHKLIVYPKAGRTQLFDLEKDPWEMHDLADDPQYASIKTDLMSQLIRKQRDLGDTLDLSHHARETAQ